jgi:signal transduction histidine kinase
MEVSDNGEGIDMKHLEKIFTMFYRGTTSSVGTGLGLYICKEIANKLNGDLYAASTLGEGTIMTITIPELARNA